MSILKYFSGYPAQLTGQVTQLIREERLTELLRKKYPTPHTIRTDKALYDFTVARKNESLRNTPPLSKVGYDGKINDLHHSLGVHCFISRVQGGKLKAKHEIKIAPVFKVAPLECLQMIVAHELAHLKEKEHNKAFYQLCEHLEPAYAQLEFDTRLYLTQLELFGPLYPASSTPCK